MNKKTDIEFVCTGECVRMCVCFFIFYKQNMTMRKRRKAPSTKKNEGGEETKMRNIFFLIDG